MTPEQITALAAERYTPDGYEGPDDCLFALLVDAAGAYTRRQGSSLSTVESVLDTVYENIAERRYEAPAACPPDIKDARRPPGSAANS